MRLRVGASRGRAVCFGLHIYIHVLLHKHIYYYSMLQSGSGEAAEQLRTAAQQIPPPMLVIVS